MFRYSNRFVTRPVCQHTQCTEGPEYTQSSDVAHISNLMSFKAEVLTDRFFFCLTSNIYIYIFLPLRINKYGQLQYALEKKGGNSG